MIRVETKAGHGAHKPTSKVVSCRSPSRVVIQGDVYHDGHTFGFIHRSTSTATSLPLWRAIWSCSSNFEKGRSLLFLARSPPSSVPLLRIFTLRLPFASNGSSRCICPCTHFDAVSLHTAAYGEAEQTKPKKNNGSIITVQAIENRRVCFLPLPPVLLCACFIFGRDTGTIRIFSSASAPIDCQLSLHIASSTFARGSFNVKSIIGCSNKKALLQRDPCLEQVCERRKNNPPEYSSGSAWNEILVVKNWSSIGAVLWKRNGNT